MVFLATHYAACWIIDEERLIPFLSEETESIWKDDEVTQHLRLTPEMVREMVREMTRREELTFTIVGKHDQYYKINNIKKWLYVQLEGNN